MLRTFLISILLLTFSADGFSEPKPKKNKLSELLNPFDFTTCIDKNLGFTVLCGKNWPIEPEKDSLLLVIKKDASQMITMKVQVHNEPELTLETLTGQTLQSTFLYKDYFKIGKTRIGKEQGIVVEGHLKKFPMVKVLDYFLIHNKFLYQIRFSVNTKKAFVEYKPVFQKIISSFVFANTNELYMTRLIKLRENEITKKKSFPPQK